MKKYLIILSAMMLVILSSCREVANEILDALPPFGVPFNSTVEVPFGSISTANYTRIPDIPMNIDLDAKIKEQNSNFGINNLKSVKLSELSINYVSSTLGTQLDSVKNCRLYIKAPNQPEKLIAYAYDNTNPNKIIFTIPDEELLEYFRTSQNSLIIEFQASRPVADQIKMDIASKFLVKVQL